MIPRSSSLVALALSVAALLSPAIAADPGPGLHYYYPVPAAEPAQTLKVDVCVYGGTYF